MRPDAVQFLDERTNSAPMLRKGLRYLFPDHWSFLLGEVALYAFMILVATGTYLTLFFDPSLGHSTYHGVYAPLRGMEMSEAYRSAIDISFKYKAGLLIRQTHHWAADLFMAAIVLHLMRVFFTGAFRKPRDLTWLIGVTLLFAGLLEGYAGYSMVDDLLSGIGLAIGYGVALSVPVIGGPLGLAIWGAPFPGKHLFESRLYIAHVFLLPGLIAVLLVGHLALVAARHHTQFRRDRRHTNKRIVGVPMFPGQAPRSLSLLFAVAALLFVLGGLVQINPIWQWGPYHTALSVNGAQPDWYIGWLIGALRLMPGFDVTVGHYTLIPGPFWGGALFPIVVIGALLAVPWADRKITGNQRFHNLLERPRDAPDRTAFGVAFLTWVVMIFVFGGADRIFVGFDISYNLMLNIFRVAIWVVPVALFFLVRTWCRNLKAAELIEADQKRAEQEIEHEQTGTGPQAQPAG